VAADEPPVAPPVPSLLVELPLLSLLHAVDRGAGIDRTEPSATPVAVPPRRSRSLSPGAITSLDPSPPIVSALRSTLTEHHQVLTSDCVTGNSHVQDPVLRLTYNCNPLSAVRQGSDRSPQGRSAGAGNLGTVVRMRPVGGAEASALWNHA
jgi:hypothetical protein